MRYQFLLNILDGIAADAPTRYTTKYPKRPADIESLNQVRARCLIHLYLKVSFGLTEFEDREWHVTDGGYDGGIDCYFIEKTKKIVYLLQSKFRTTESNFESKEISYEEILGMDVTRILEGMSTDHDGNEYSGKIKQFQRELGEIEDIARYKYKVILLANLRDPPLQKLAQLFGGYPIEIVNSQRMYEELVFPVLSGTYFTATDLTIPIDLSNKNAGSKISYEVSTKYADCEITALFVPAIEIAKIMNRYKNAVLKYNPRSYLDLEGQAVNLSIRETVLNSTTNELALYNNGITMLSEETSINERIGQRSKAQLYVKNPQIINGGQTSYTLSRIYSDPNVDATAVFGNKELMLKVITVPACDADKKGQLIDEISAATNRQTPVITADRFANDSFHYAVQVLIFNRFGLLYERKRGEFSDGVRDGYVEGKEILERNVFWRIYFAANGDLEKAIQRRLFQKNRFDKHLLSVDKRFDRWHLGLLAFRRLEEIFGKNVKFGKVHYAKIYACVELLASEQSITADQIDEAIDGDNGFWKQFMRSVARRYETNPGQFPERVMGRGGRFAENRYYKSGVFIRDVKRAVTERLGARLDSQSVSGNL